MHPGKLAQVQRQVRLIADGDPSAGRAILILHHAHLGMQLDLAVLGLIFAHLLIHLFHDGLAEGVGFLAVAVPAGPVRRLEDAVDALRQTHIAEHADHMVRVLMDQALLAEVGVLIVMAGIHDKLGPLINHLAHGRRHSGNHLVQELLFRRGQLRQILHIQPHQGHAGAADGQRVIAADHRIVSVVRPVHRIIGKAGLRAHQPRTNGGQGQLIGRIRPVKHAHIGAGALHLGRQIQQNPGGPVVPAAEIRMEERIAVGRVHMRQQHLDGLAGLPFVLNKGIQQLIQAAGIHRQGAGTGLIVIKAHQIPHCLPDILRGIQLQKGAALLHEQRIIRHAVARPEGGAALEHLENDLLIDQLAGRFTVFNDIQLIVRSLGKLDDPLPEGQLRVCDQIQHFILKRHK